MSRSRKTCPPAAGEVLRHRARARSAKRGVASVLAMLYLVIFATLALGFYTGVTTSVQVAHNDERAMMAHVAAESGLQFVRYQLAQVRFPSNTPNDKILQEVFNDLVAQTLNSDNLGGHAVGMAGDTIYLPGSADNYFIPLDGNGAGFRATIVDLGNGNLRVKVVGRYRGVTITRALEEDFESIYSSLNIFDFGVVTKGPVTLSGTSSVSGPNPLEGSVLSLSPAATPVSLGGSATIAGDIYLTNKDAGVSMTGGVSVGGTSNSALRATHIHTGVPEPELPTVDTDVFRPFAVNKYVAGKGTYTNTYVPPNTNPKFTSATTIEGVMFVDYPNSVTFNAQTTIRGVIAVKNGAPVSSANQINFGGGIVAYGVETLPNDAQFPPELRKLTGSVLLAPGFGVSLSGSSGAIGGTMVADSFSLVGGSGGVVHGNLIGLGAAGMSFKGGGSIARTKSDEIPAGLVLNRTFKSLPKSYVEVLP